MASRRRPSDPPPLEIRRFTLEQAERAIKSLGARLVEVKALDPQNVRHDDEKVKSTARRIVSTVLEVFGENSPEYRAHQYHEIQKETLVLFGGGFGDDPSDHEAEEQQNFAGGIPRTVTMLESLIDTVRERRCACGSSGGPASDNARLAPAGGQRPITRDYVRFPRPTGGATATGGG